MPNLSHKSVIVAYVPVLHRGYLQFFEKQKAVSEIWVIGEQLLKKTDYLRKDLRRLPPAIATELIQTLVPDVSVAVLLPVNVKKLDQPNTEIILPDEDVSHSLAKTFTKATVTFYPVFLRWDRKNVDKVPETEDAKTTKTPRDITNMTIAMKTANASSDIWRRVGAVLVDPRGKVVETVANYAEPDNQTSLMEGDPRNIFSRGVAIELSLFTHAEARLIAEAAKNGYSLQKHALYITTFPCPACAKLIAHSGITKLFYKDGYAVLDGLRVLENYGVSISQVITGKLNFESPDSLVPYTK